MHRLLILLSHFYWLDLFQYRIPNFKLANVDLVLVILFPRLYSCWLALLGAHCISVLHSYWLALLGAHCISILHSYWLALLRCWPYFNTSFLLVGIALVLTLFLYFIAIGCHLSGVNFISVLYSYILGGVALVPVKGWHIAGSNNLLGTEPATSNMVADTWPRQS